MVYIRTNEWFVLATCLFDKVNNTGSWYSPCCGVRKRWDNFYSISRTNILALRIQTSTDLKQLRPGFLSPMRKNSKSQHDTDPFSIRFYIMLALMLKRPVDLHQLQLKLFNKGFQISPIHDWRRVLKPFWVTLKFMISFSYNQRGLF